MAKKNEIGNGQIGNEQNAWWKLFSTQMANNYHHQIRWMIQCKFSSYTDLQFLDFTWQTNDHHSRVYEYLAILSFGHTE